MEINRIIVRRIEPALYFLSWYTNIINFYIGIFRTDNEDILIIWLKDKQYKAKKLKDYQESSGIDSTRHRIMNSIIACNGSTRFNVMHQYQGIVSRRDKAISTKI